MIALAVAAALPAKAAAADAQELEARVEQLERELAAARAELEEVRASEQEAQNELEVVRKKVAETKPLGPDKIEIEDGLGGTLKIGGAMRVNYAIGDYGPPTGAPTRAEDDGGSFELDTFRINLDYANGPVIGKFEYRFYQKDFTSGGSHFLHTGWLGYNFDDGGQVQVGVNRVPFGPGPYGVSQSWFFDQHYYVGLSDDMDLGVKYSRPFGDWQFDVAYYYRDEGSWAGNSAQSARYSYDVVNETGSGYEERNQFNIRGIYGLKDVPVSTDIGFSLQYGQLESNGAQDDGEHYAASVHMVNKWNNFTLATQLTRYEYDFDAYTPSTATTIATPTDKVIQFGAYDFPSLAASKAWIPAVSLSYYQETAGIPWLDYVVPYAEYSSIVKDESGFNDSELFVLGAAWARGGWYIYTDLAFSNGNEFVGGETAFGDRLGANPDDRWLWRFNTNFGYYF